MTLPAALYARTPDPTQPIAVAISRLRAYITGQGWTLADEHAFQDANYSGLVFERPGLEALLAALQHGEFVRLVTAHPDTLSRTLSDRWCIENTAARMGCRIVYLEEERAGPLVVTGGSGRIGDEPCPSWPGRNWVTGARQRSPRRVDYGQTVQVR